MCQSMKLDPYLTDSLNRYQRPKVRSKIIKFLEENTGRKLHNIRHGNDLLAVTTDTCDKRKNRLNRFHDNLKKFVHPKTLSTESESDS